MYLKVETEARSSQDIMTDWPNNFLEMKIVFIQYQFTIKWLNETKISMQSKHLKYLTWSRSHKSLIEGSLDQFVSIYTNGFISIWLQDISKPYLQNADTIVHYNEGSAACSIWYRLPCPEDWQKETVLFPLFIKCTLFQTSSVYNHYQHSQFTVISHKKHC